MSDQTSGKTASQSTTNNNSAIRAVRLKSGVTIDLNMKVHSGQLSNVLFKKENGFAILKIGGVPCIGVFREIAIGGSYDCTGEFQEDRKFKGQWNFKVKDYRLKIDSTNGIRELLVSEAPGVGPALANRLLAKFKLQTFDVLASSPEKVSKEIGISISAANLLMAWAVGQKSNSRIKEKLYGIGITTGLVSKLIAEYGNNAAEKIRKDCFSLTKLKGFGFITVAKIADLIGVPADDPGRIYAALKYAMDSIYEEGHVCIAATELLRVACELVGLTQSKVIPILEKMLKENELIGSETIWQQYRDKLKIEIP